MIVDLLYDAVLPQSLSSEATGALRFVRWDQKEQPDMALVRMAAARNYRGVVFFERDSLQQPDLQEKARQAGVALIAVDAEDPIQAKERLINNSSRLRRALADHDCLLVLAREVRPYD